MKRSLAISWFEAHLPGTDSGLASVRESYEAAIEGLRAVEAAEEQAAHYEKHGDLSEAEAIRGALGAHGEASASRFPTPFFLRPGDRAILEYDRILSKDAVERIKEAWADATGCVRPIVLDGGLLLAGAILAKPIKPSSPAEIAEFVETVKASK